MYTLPDETHRELYFAWKGYQDQVKGILSKYDDATLRTFAGDVTSEDIEKVIGDYPKRMARLSALTVVSDRFHEERRKASTSGAYCVYHAQDLTLCAAEHGLLDDEEQEFLEGKD